MSCLNVIDVWRVLHADEKAYTWSKAQPFIARRLDYCFVNDNVMQSCVSCDIVSLPNTDHRAVTLRLSTSFVHGPGYWRFNNSYLKDPVFVDKMNDMLENALIEEMQISNTQNVWDLTKVKIRDFCIDYRKNKASKFRNRELSLQTKLEELVKHLPANKDDQPLHAEVLKIYYFTPNGKDKALNTLKTTQKTTKNDYLL